MREYISIAVMLLFLSGCALAPGGHVDVDGKYADEDTDTQLDNVGIYAITPKLIERLSKRRTGDSIPAPLSSLSNKITDYQYQIGIGDILSIIIWGSPEVIKDQQAENQPTLRVNSRGDIYYPYVGSLHVAGMSLEQARLALEKKLNQFVKDPQVSVDIVRFESQKMYLTGEIKQPGTHPISNIPLTVLDAINRAGGLTSQAEWGGVTLSRDGNTIPISLYELMQKGNLAQNYVLKHGDIINVPRNELNNVYLMGEVKKPQTLRMGRYGLSLTRALSDAGGVNEYTASPSGIFVIRGNQHRLLASEQLENPIADIYQLSIRDATSFALAERFPLLAGDVIYVTAAPISRWNRVIRSIMPTIGAVNAIENLSE